MRIDREQSQVTIESEKAIDNEIVLAEYLGVHPLAKFSEFLERS